MVEIHPNLYIGNENSCSWHPSSGWAMIHACKHPCHRKAVGYKSNLSSSHPNYLIWERGNHLVLNMVDMEKELSPKFTNPIMKAAMSFIEKQVPKNKILIHCNLGQSRSPSIGLIYLARIGVIENSSYQNAKIDFRRLYSKYQPGLGIATYMRRHWSTLMQI